MKRDALFRACKWKRYEKMDVVWGHESCGEVYVGGLEEWEGRRKEERVAEIGAGGLDCGCWG